MGLFSFTRHLVSLLPVAAWRLFKKEAWGVGMKTLGELEAAICKGVSGFEHDYMGRGPKDIHTDLLGDLLVVRRVHVRDCSGREPGENVNRRFPVYWVKMWQMELPR